MATSIDASRLLLYRAAAAKDSGGPFSAQASMAKLFASEMVNRVTAQAIQMHGGYGVTKDYPVERFYRDAKMADVFDGTKRTQKTIISNELVKARSI